MAAVFDGAPVAVFDGAPAAVFDGAPAAVFDGAPAAVFAACGAQVRMARIKRRVSCTMMIHCIKMYMYCSINYTEYL